MTIDEAVLYRLLMNNSKAEDGFTMIEDEITSSDMEDGGADHDFVIKENATGDFYAGSYSDWDIENTDYDYDNNVVDGRCDLNTNLYQVYPEQVTITVYKPKSK